jgi:hypothetical protein
MTPEERFLFCIELKRLVHLSRVDAKYEQRDWDVMDVMDAIWPIVEEVLAEDNHVVVIERRSVARTPT